MSNMSSFSFIHPSTILISGPTQSGKTHFVTEVISNKLIQPFPNRIIWLYKEWQDTYERLKAIVPEIVFHRGIQEELLESITPTETNLVVIDDLMGQAAESKKITELFTQESHHRNLTVILIVQNLFYRGKEMRTISLNAHYFVLYKNPRDKTHIRFLAQQIYPENWKFLVNVFTHATREPHSYLIINLHPETAEQFRLASNIFTSEQIRYYLPD